MRESAEGGASSRMSCGIGRVETCGSFVTNPQVFRRSGLAFEGRGDADLGFQHLGDWTSGLGVLHGGVELGFVGAGDLGTKVEMDLGDGKAGVELLQSDGRGGVERRSSQAGGAEL